MTKPPAKKYTFVIFDWDGTLMDSTDKIVSCIQTTAKMANLAVPSASKVKSTIGLKMWFYKRYFPRLLKGMGVSFTMSKALYY